MDKRGWIKLFFVCHDPACANIESCLNKSSQYSSLYLIQITYLSQRGNCRRTKSSTINKKLMLDFSNDSIF